MKWLDEAESHFSALGVESNFQDEPWVLKRIEVGHTASRAVLFLLELGRGIGRGIRSFSRFWHGEA